MDLVTTRRIALVLLAAALGCSRTPKLNGIKAPVPIYGGAQLDMDDEPFGGFKTDGERSMIDGTFWYLA